MTVFVTARPEHLDALIGLLADDPIGAVREDLSAAGRPVYAAALEAVTANPATELIVALEGEAVVGVVQLIVAPGLVLKGATRAELEGLRVRHDRRRTGLGARLVEEAMARARAKGAAFIQLTSNRARMDAHSFYERMGFTLTHDGYRRPL
jgi:GNAT superfamily N-acetyltransferase